MLCTSKVVSLQPYPSLFFYKTPLSCKIEKSIDILLIINLYTIYMHSIVHKKNITFLYKLLIADRANINTRIIILKPEKE